MTLHPEHDPIREFDAHIYYTPDTRGEADALRERIRAEFSPKEVKVGRLIDRPVGPHPIPMFEINFKRTERDRVLNWLTRNRGDHTVLFHEVTGDDPRDHTDGALWLGDALPLDFSRLDPSPSR